MLHSFSAIPEGNEGSCVSGSVQIWNARHTRLNVASANVVTREKEHHRQKHGEYENMFYVQLLVTKGVPKRTFKSDCDSRGGTYFGK